MSQIKIVISGGTEKKTQYLAALISTLLCGDGIAAKIKPEDMVPERGRGLGFTPVYIGDKDLADRSVLRVQIDHGPYATGATAVEKQSLRHLIAHRLRKHAIPAKVEVRRMPYERGIMPDPGVRRAIKNLSGCEILVTRKLPENKTPDITINIHGQQGVGKSVLLQMLGNHLGMIFFKVEAKDWDERSRLIAEPPAPKACDHLRGTIICFDSAGLLRATEKIDIKVQCKRAQREASELVTKYIVGVLSAAGMTIAVWQGQPVVDPNGVKVVTVSDVEKLGPLYILLRVVQ